MLYTSREFSIFACVFYGVCKFLRLITFAVYANKHTRIYNRRDYNRIPECMYNRNRIGKKDKRAIMQHREGLLSVLYCKQLSR